MLVTINFNHFYRCHIVFYHILERQTLTIFPFNFSLTWDIETWNEARFERRVHFCERKSVRRILCFSDGFEQYSYVCFPSKFLPKFLYTTSFPIPGEFSHAASSAIRVNISRWREIFEKKWQSSGQSGVQNRISRFCIVLHN